MFSFFSNKKPNKVPVSLPFGFMGKSPIQADFVKYHVDSREVINMDHWLQEGYAHVCRSALQGDSHFDDQLTTLFFIAGGEADNSMMGVLQPSQDKSGRQYPFSSFILCSNADFKTHPAFLLYERFNIIRSLILNHELIKSASSLEMMQKTAHELQPLGEMCDQELDFNTSMEALRKQPIERIWFALGLSTVEQRGALIEQLMHALKGLSAQGCKRSQFGIKLPMPQLGDDSKLVVAFWLHLITNTVADNHWQPWCFYNFGQLSCSASLVVYCRPVPASFFASVWLDLATGSTVMDFTKLNDNQPLSSKALELAKATNMSVFDTLRSWSKV
ncbi:type VI secretion system-associated protein TagF [Pseudoalteromonas umbrosa]|uniref:type VI secretion system-associated protein TagF n=1 Tax=Pseudoalteromonas umbrosa TaxID=3048489 RepID=UPI0024C3D848|nr:type VI secretion system-associated protein TagF [Pseudoalteromonas sp. B95]MDK1288250.1 type VI secretion system-associated protein TagF [Pseudoalteromonas sp. B95]